MIIKTINNRRINSYAGLHSNVLQILGLLFDPCVQSTAVVKSLQITANLSVCAKNNCMTSTAVRGAPIKFWVDH